MAELDASDQSEHGDWTVTTPVIYSIAVSSPVTPAEPKLAKGDVNAPFPPRAERRFA